MSIEDPVVIVAAVRTPLGRFQGELSSFSAHQLGSHAITEALKRSEVSPDQVDEVLMGCVLPAGQGQAPARQAARGACLPDATPVPAWAERFRSLTCKMPTGSDAAMSTAVLSFASSDMRRSIALIFRKNTG